MELKGSFFAQQHSILNVCAHTAIKSVFENLQNYGVKVPSMYDINNVLNKKDMKNQIYDGMSMLEIKEVITTLGLYCMYFENEALKSAAMNYQQVAYYAIESGFPVIIYFSIKKDSRQTTETEGHVITTIGHSFNNATWLPIADKNYFQVTKKVGYFRSSAWMDHFIINDDNYGPYFCLPSNYLDDKEPHILIVCPYKLDIFGDYAEIIAAHELYEWIIPNLKRNKVMPLCNWMKYFIESFNKKELILRTIFITKHNYKEYLESLEEKDLIIIKYYEQLPEYFWVVEISLPELFTINRKKIGEIIIPTTIENCPFLSVRLPKLFMYLANSKEREVIFSEISSEHPIPIIKNKYTM